MTGFQRHPYKKFLLAWVSFPQPRTFLFQDLLPLPSSFPSHWPDKAWEISARQAGKCSLLRHVATACLEVRRNERTRLTWSYATLSLCPPADSESTPAGLDSDL